MSPTVSRRTFVASSAGAIAALVVSPLIARAASPPSPTGPVYGVVGSRGIVPGPGPAPSSGMVTLLDGTTLEASHTAGHAIGAGRSVFLTPEADGGWSVLYAEV